MKSTDALQPQLVRDPYRWNQCGRLGEGQFQLILSAGFRNFYRTMPHGSINNLSLPWKLWSLIPRPICISTLWLEERVMRILVWRTTNYLSRSLFSIRDEDRITSHWLMIVSVRKFTSGLEWSTTFMYYRLRLSALHFLTFYLTIVSPQWKATVKFNLGRYFHSKGSFKIPIPILMKTILVMR